MVDFAKARMDFAAQLLRTHVLLNSGSQGSQSHISTQSTMYDAAEAMYAKCFESPRLKIEAVLVS